MEVLSSMAGSVRELPVNVGDRVTERQELLILDSMKMEVPVESTGRGTVVEIVVTPPVAVDEGQVLLRIGD